MSYTKAEILLTRACNLRCSFCNMVKNIEDLDSETWKKIFKKLKDWKVEFLALYGAEPTMRGDLLKIVGDVKKLGFDFTLISNGLLLDDNYLKQLALNGLESLTVSVDISPYDTSSKLKSIKGLEILTLAYNLKLFRDLDACTTLTKENIENFYDYIKDTNETLPGMWISFDIVHFEDGRDDSKCKPNPYRKKYFDRETVEKYKRELSKVRDGILSGELKNVHQTPEAIQVLIDNNFEYKWRCTKPTQLSIDCDGSIRVCDDFRGIYKDNKPANFLDITEEYFKNVWDEAVSKCTGCLWTTHIMSEQMHEKSKKHFSHRS